MTNEPRPQAAGGIDLRIDELVLHGFPSIDHRVIGEAMNEELHRLLSLSAPSLRSNPNASQEQRRAPSFEVDASASPATIGSQLGRAVYGWLVLGNDAPLSIQDAQR